jgi:L-ascorbate metabolism protein UlaG (beta-lactamase superfamily)
MKSLLTGISLFAMLTATAQNKYEEDLIKTSRGDVKITFIGHGTLMLTINNFIVHIDPWSNVGNYSSLPKADLILVTHEHGDHLDKKTIESIRKAGTTLIYTAKCNDAQPGLKGTVLSNGEHKLIGEIEVEAVPAYNLLNKRPDGNPFHPKGEGNGYVLTIGDKKFYIAGDTENTPEMKALKNIDVAFLPMNLPYTMTPEMVADAAKAFHPGILYPYHTGETDITKLAELLKGSGIDVRYRKMK